jgi:hypothetical protein
MIWHLEANHKALTLSRYIIFYYYQKKHLFLTLYLTQDWPRALGRIAKANIIFFEIDTCAHEQVETPVQVLAAKPKSQHITLRSKSAVWLELARSSSLL